MRLPKTDMAEIIRIATRFNKESFALYFDRIK